MLLSCWTCSIFTSLLFLHVDSQQWWRKDVGTMDLCGPDTCANGYRCKVDDQGIYCERLGGLDSFGGGTFNINSNNNYDDVWFLNWIFRLIRLMASIFQQNRSSNSETNPDLPADESTTMDDTETDAPKEPCNPNPCLYEGVCTPVVENNTFTCECNYPTSGDTCQDDVGQCTNCVRYGNEVLYLFNQTAVNFDRAKNLCESNKLQMYTPKTAKVSNFFRDYLLREVPKDPKPMPAYYIGLKRENDTQSFRWIDDDAKATFSDWVDRNGPADDGPSYKRSCVLLSSGVNEFRWLNEKCGYQGLRGYEYYAACTGTYDFFGQPKVQE